MRGKAIVSIVIVSIVGLLVLRTEVAGSATGDADRVDGLDAVRARATLEEAAGRLVAHAKSGAIPRRFVPKAGDADTLDGLDSTQLDAATLDGLDSTELDATTVDGLDSTDLLTEVVGADSGSGAVLSTDPATDVASLTLAPGSYLLLFSASPAITGGWGSVECSAGGRQESFWFVGEPLASEYVQVSIAGDMTIITTVQAAAPTTFTASCWLTQTGIPGVVGAIAGAVSDVSMFAIEAGEIHSGSNV